MFDEFNGWNSTLVSRVIFPLWDCLILPCKYIKYPSYLLMWFDENQPICSWIIWASSMELIPLRFILNKFSCIKTKACVLLSSLHWPERREKEPLLALIGPKTLIGLRACSKESFPFLVIITDSCFSLTQEIGINCSLTDSDSDSVYCSTKIQIA
jgi:hypothetical protein